MKAKVNKAKTNHGDKGVPFNLPKRTGSGSEKMGSMGMKGGGKVKKYARGGGIEQQGKTRGKIC